MGRDEARATWDAQIVPDSGRPFFQSGFSLLAPRAPPASTSPIPIGAPAVHRRGGRPCHADRRHPPEAPGVPGVARCARTSASFPGRTHWLIAQDGWEEVAAGCHDWIASLAEPGAGSSRHRWRDRGRVTTDRSRGREAGVPKREIRGGASSGARRHAQWGRAAAMRRPVLAAPALDRAGTSGDLTEEQTREPRAASGDRRSNRPRRARLLGPDRRGRSGLAGLSVALHLADRHRVVVLAKRGLNEAATAGPRAASSACWATTTAWSCTSTTPWLPAAACRRARRAVRRGAQRPRHRVARRAGRAVHDGPDGPLGLHLTREGGHARPAHRPRHRRDRRGDAARR